MVVLQCSVPNCPFVTDDVTDIVAVALLNNHNLAHNYPQHKMQSPPRAIWTLSWTDPTSTWVWIMRPGMLLSADGTIFVTDPG